MERKFKASVNHGGSCQGIHFQMNVPVILPQSAINALGAANVKILCEIDPPKPDPIPEAQKEVEEVKKEEPKEETKEVKNAPVNKMVGKNKKDLKSK